MVKKKIFVKAVLVLLLAGILLPGKVWAATSVADVIVLSSSNIVDRNVAFNIYFKPRNSLIGGRDTITVRFPEAYYIAESISAVNVSVNDRTPYGVVLNNNLLTVILPPEINIPAGQQAVLSIASAMIKNPKEAGSYQFSVFTSQDLQEALSAPVVITDFEYADGVSKAVVSAALAADNVPLSYKISFKVPAGGKLAGGDVVYLTFPASVRLPATIGGSNVKINGTGLAYYQINISGQQLSLPVPAGIYVPPYGTVTVEIAPEAMLQRQGTVSDGSLWVFTSVNQRAVESLTYNIISDYQLPTGQQQLSVTVNPNGSGVAAAYTINIKSDILMKLGSKLDSIIISFPSNTWLPSQIDASKISINGMTPTGTLVSLLNNKRDLIVLLPAEVYTNQSINIVIDQSAGIINPAAADYRLDVGTIRDWNVVTSDWYRIETQSTTSPLLPDNPTNPSAGNSGNLIILQIDNKTAYVNNTAKLLSTAPVIINGTTMVPLRFIGDAFNATTEFNSAGQFATVKYNGKEMVLWVNSSVAKVNGVFLNLQTPATIRDDTMLVPIRFISENFGAQVIWDEATRKITIVQEGGIVPATPATPGTSPQQPYPIGYQVTVRTGSSVVNLRSGPGLTYPAVGRLYQGESREILAVDGEWYQVQLPSGQKAWVANWVVDVSQG